MNKKEPEVSVLIVSYNTRDMTVDCIASVLAQPGGGFSRLLLSTTIPRMDLRMRLLLVFLRYGLFVLPKIWVLRARTMLPHNMLAATSFFY